MPSLRQARIRKDEEEAGYRPLIERSVFPSEAGYPSVGKLSSDNDVRSKTD
jgi:hypothetical protein